jgi:hypothetical protein
VSEDVWPATLFRLASEKNRLTANPPGHKPPANNPQAELGLQIRSPLIALLMSPD